MKKRRYLTFWTALAFGSLGALLRLWLLHAGYDQRGLLVAWHPAALLCWITAAVAAGFLLYLTARVRPMGKYSKTFPASPIAAGGCAVAAVGIAIHAISALRAASGFVSYACFAAGIAGGAAMGYAAYCRFLGKRPGCYPAGIVTVYFMLLLVSRYRGWMAQSQPQEYVFSLLLHVCLMLSFFHRAELDGNGVHFRAYLRYTLASFLFGCISLPGSGDWLFILPMLLYLAAELISFRLPKRKKAARVAPPEEPAP